MGPSILDRQDGDTIDIDFEELYGLYDGDINGVNLPETETQTDSDILASCWSSGNVIEDSLEAIRSVLSSANIPANNRNIIEKSLTTLRNAMELPAEVGAGMETDLRLDDWAPPPPPPPPGPEVRSEGGPEDCYAAVAAAAEEESRVREALGISQAPWSDQADHATDNLPLYNENFYRDRERQGQDQADSLSLWIEDLSPGASLEEISDPQDFLPSSAEEISPSHFQPYDQLPASSSPSQCSTSVASVDNVLDQSFLLSGGEAADTWGGKQVTVTRLVPYRIKKIPQDEKKSCRKERQTKDEKMAKVHNLPYTVDHIINCNMEEFTDILNNTDLNTDQLNLCRDIRKRGKNKVKYLQSVAMHFFKSRSFIGYTFMFQIMSVTCPVLQ